MNVIYVKTILYAYPKLIGLTTRLDATIEKLAVNSLHNYKPALEQYNQIAELIYQKRIMLSVKKYCYLALKKLSEEELNLVKCKYFGKKELKSAFEQRFGAREYYRKQNAVIKKISTRLERYEINDEFFEKNCLSVPFLKWKLNIVKSKESRGKAKAKTENAVV